MIEDRNAYMRGYLRKRRAEARAKGMCPDHPDRPVRDGYKQCAECIVKKNAANKRRAARGSME